MEKLRYRLPERLREIQRKLERRHLKSAPSDPDGSGKLAVKLSGLDLGK